MTYYHIQELSNGKPEWKTGEQYDISESDFNWFYKLLINGIGDTKTTDGNEQIRLVKYVDQYLYDDIEKKCSENDINYKHSLLQATVDILKDSLKQNLKWIQEEVFENIRLTLFPDLPSRKNCLWVCENQHLEKWWELFSSKDDNFKIYDRKILELRLEGKFHKADGRLMDPDTYKIEDFETRARTYWNGTILSEDRSEILFVGKAIVINVFKDLNEIKTKPNKF